HLVQGALAIDFLKPRPLARGTHDAIQDITADFPDFALAGRAHIRGARRATQAGHLAEDQRLGIAGRMLEFPLDGWDFNFTFTHDKRGVARIALLAEYVAGFHF